MIIGGITLPTGFTGDFQGEIEPGAYQDVEVTFAPGAAGDYGGGLEVASDANAGAMVNAQWTGKGYTGVLFSDWLADQAVPAEERGPLDDSNGDGVPNLLAYFFNVPANGLLTAADRAAMPTARHGKDEIGSYLAIRYRHNRDAELVTVALETSPDLSPGSWVAVTPDAVIEQPDDPVTGDYIREVRLRTVGNQTKKFARLKVTQSP